MKIDYFYITIIVIWMVAGLVAIFTNKPELFWIAIPGTVLTWLCETLS